MRPTATRVRRARPGVVLLHVGPGMTNAVTGVATAAFDSVPLLVIAGDVPSYYEGRGPHQEFNLRRDADQVSVYEPFVKRAWRVRRADQVPRDPRPRLGHWPLAGRPGPGPRVGPDGHPRRGPRGADRAGLAGRATGAQRPRPPRRSPTELRGASRPLLLAGGGTRRATRRGRAARGGRRRCPSRTRSWAPASCRRTTRSCSG